MPDLERRLVTLSGGQRQGVAVARAVMWASKVVIMDEPTAALGVAQTAKVLDLIRQVRDTGIPVVFISHNMPNVFQVADRIVVLRLGAGRDRARSEDRDDRRCGGRDDGIDAILEPRG